MRPHLCLLLATATLAACSVDVGSTTDHATDTFAKPTHHGELFFDGRNEARFTDSQRFHGWSFTLPDAATVQLGTDIKTDNLDTVMYLYNADSEGKKLGGNIAKDDNGGEDQLSSLLEVELEAGTYFVQVKTKNTAMRGRFFLAASCAGAGCPVLTSPSPEDACDGAHEAIGKCMDDGHTEEECAPGGSDSVLCCNAFEDDEWFCADLCEEESVHLARAWNDDYEAVYDVYPGGEFSYYMDIYAYALNTCASPDLATVMDEVVEGVDIVELEDEDLRIDIEPWLPRADPEFFNWSFPEAVVSKIDSIVGEQATRRFEAYTEIPCPNCTDGISVHGLLYPTVGKVVVVHERWGGDS